jgi:hypothetical protein
MSPTRIKPKAIASSVPIPIPIPISKPVPSHPHINATAGPTQTHTHAHNNTNNVTSSFLQLNTQSLLRLSSLFRQKIKPPPRKPHISFHTYKPAPSTVLITVLPTLNNNLVFHVRTPTPSNGFERAGIVAGLVSRKWRMSVWDEVAGFWHGAFVGSDRSVYSWDRFRFRVYMALNRLTTRQCDEEYFFKCIPLMAKKVCDLST